jgi:hypothetical protein
MIKDTNEMLIQRGFGDLEGIGMLVNGIPTTLPEISVCP